MLTDCIGLCVTYKPVHLIATSVYIAQGRLLSWLGEPENHLGPPSTPVLLLSFPEKLHNLDFTFLFFFFGQTSGILIPQPGIEPGPLEVKAQSPNHWTTGEFSSLHFLMGGQPLTQPFVLCNVPLHRLPFFLPQRFIRVREVRGLWKIHMEEEKMVAEHCLAKHLQTFRQFTQCLRTRW